MTLNAENYHSAEANQLYLSVSQYKDFTDCEARALARLRGKYIQPGEKCLQLGQYLHAWNEGKLTEFTENNRALIFKKTGDKGKYDDFIKADTAIAVLENDLLAMKALDGEKEVILTGEIDGVPWKCRADNLGAVRFSDLKYVKDFSPMYDTRKGKRVSWIEHWGYHYQMALYQEVVRQNTGNQLEPLIVAVTKESPPDKGIFGGFEQYELDGLLEVMKIRQKRIIAIKNGAESPDECGKCDWCRSIKRLVSVIRWDVF